MSSPEPNRLLEPSDLLAPIELENRYGESVTGAAVTGDSVIAPPRGERAAMQRGRGGPTIARRRRRSLKPVLFLAGGLACFGAGAALPDFRNLRFGDFDPMAASVTQPPVPAAAPVQSAESTAAGMTAPEPTPGSNPNAAPPANAVTPVNAGAASSPDVPDRSAPAAAPPRQLATDGTGGGTGCPAHADDSKCLVGGARSPARPAAPVPLTATAKPDESPRSDARAPGQQEAVRTEERPQPRSSKRAARRDSAERQPAAEEDGGSARRSASGGARAASSASRRRTAAGVATATTIPAMAAAGPRAMTTAATIIAARTIARSVGSRRGARMRCRFRSGSSVVAGEAGFRVNALTAVSPREPPAMELRLSATVFSR